MPTTTGTNRWLRIGLTLAWLMILGGLFGVLSARIGERPTSLYIVVVLAGTLLNAGLLKVSWRRARAFDSAADGRGIGRAEWPNAASSTNREGRPLRAALPTPPGHNPYDAPAIESHNDEPSLGPDSRDAPQTRPSYWRYAIATVATVAFLSLGYMFLVSMRGRQWLEASAYLAGSLSAIPWALHESRARDCFAGSIVIAVGSVCAAASQVCYFAMFDVEWFNDIFNEKGAGELGMLLFGSVAFVGSGYLCWRLLALVGLTTPPSHLLQNPTGSGEIG